MGWCFRGALFVRLLLPRVAYLYFVLLQFDRVLLVGFALNFLVSYNTGYLCVFGVFGDLFGLGFLVCLTFELTTSGFVF